MPGGDDLASSVSWDSSALAAGPLIQRAGARRPRDDVAAAAAQHGREADRDRAPATGPPRTPGSWSRRRWPGPGRRTGRVHRHAADRSRPRGRQRRTRRRRARRSRRVLRSRCSAQDHAHQQRGENDLHQQRLRFLLPRPRQSPQMLNVPEHPAPKQPGQRRGGELDDDVARDTLPREVPAQRKGQRRGRVQCARTAPMNRMITVAVRARRDDRRRQADLPFA